LWRGEERLDDLEAEANQEALNIPMMGFVTASAISVALWILIAWLWSLAI